MSEQEVRKKWGFLIKSILPECTDSSPVDDLDEFVTNHMMVQSGTVPHELIGKNRYN